jgi:hypothetical protein
VTGPWITRALGAADQEYRERIGKEDDRDSSDRARVARLETRALCKSGEEGLEGGDDRIPELKAE